MNLNTFTHIFLIGAGGIGMSALARYFKSEGRMVAGYDRNKSSLTTQLEKEGIAVLYSDNPSQVPAEFTGKRTLVIYTPAVPDENKLFTLFREKGVKLHKRAEVLGWLTKEKFAVAVAGTHGKTTTTTLIAHILKSSGTGCSAFLGGISVNYNSNYLADPASQNIVVEADEYDRSFLHLFPDIAVVTSMDADHLDVYGDQDQVQKTYNDFIDHVSAGGRAIVNARIVEDVRTLRAYSTYASATEADYWSDNISVRDGRFVFDLHAPGIFIPEISLGVPGRHNVENATAAAAVALMMKVDARKVKAALESFKGVQRRFEFHIRRDDLVFIDDYAHHPAELAACIRGIRELYPEKKITGIFQPHLYSRTRDFANAFAASLDLLDECYLLEIYPAREKPIEGVSSAMIAEKMKSENVKITDRKSLMVAITQNKPEVLVTMGAGDIDQLVPELKKALK